MTYAPMFNGRWPAQRSRNALEELKQLRKDIAAAKVRRLEIDRAVPLLTVLMDGSETAEDFGGGSRLGFANLFAHLVWREYSPHARSWIVVPIQAHPVEGHDSEHVAFFLGTFKDTDRNGDVLRETDLEERINSIRVLTTAGGATDYKRVFLARVLERHLQTLRSTSGAALAHDIRRLISRGIVPAIRDLKGMEEELEEAGRDSSAIRRLQKVENDLAKMESHLERLEVVVDSFVDGVISPEDLTANQLIEILSVIGDEIRHGFNAEHDAVVTTTCVVAPDFTFRSHPAVIETILLKLISNACQHGRCQPPHPRTGQAVVGVELAGSGPVLTLTVRDEGPKLRNQHGVDELGSDDDLTGFAGNGGKRYSLDQIRTLVRMHRGEGPERKENDRAGTGWQVTLTLVSLSKEEVHD